MQSEFRNLLLASNKAETLSGHQEIPQRSARFPVLLILYAAHGYLRDVF